MSPLPPRPPQSPDAAVAQLRTALAAATDRERSRDALDPLPERYVVVAVPLPALRLVLDTYDREHAHPRAS